MISRFVKYILSALFFIVLLALICSEIVLADSAAKDLVVFTTNGTRGDAHKRLLRSAKIYGYDVKVPSGVEGFVDAATQLKLLREMVEKYSKQDPNKLILFIDGPHAILSSGPLRVVEEFDASQGGILFAIDSGRQETESGQIKVVTKRSRSIDAGAFVGKAEQIHLLLKEFPDEDDLQLIMKKAYEKESLKKKYNLKIDYSCNLFQNLNGALGDLELRFAGKEAYLQNTYHTTVPVVIRAQERTIPILNTFGAYLARSWNEEMGCRECWEDMINLEGVADDQLPLVTVAVFIERPAPFLEEFLNLVENITYPKSRLYLFVHNSMEVHSEMVDTWVDKVRGEYKEIKHISFDEKGFKEWQAKNQVLDFCLERDCSHVFFLDSDAMIDNPYTLKLLIGQNRKVIAPMLARPGKAWSNFWGTITSDGFYARSMDYMEIVQQQRRGVWNVPYISVSMLVQRSVFEDPKTRPSFVHNLLDPDMAFCQNLRDKGVFMYVSNRVDFGHLINSENFNPNNMNPELWQMFDNRYDWEKRYIHPNYSVALNENTTNEQPCPDVFWFPTFTERFAQDMVNLMESFDQWSSGSNDDARIEGGYESVPTVDIHMYQVNFHNEWLEILRAYVQPLQMKVYEGYNNDVGPPRAQIAFVVRYKPDEQPYLRPHHDSSTYTINIGLNRPGIDYQGGGCRFIRYNCSVVATRVGWMLMHPGRLTHLHEGLPVTGGTRYIGVTFIDP